MGDLQPKWSKASDFAPKGHRACAKSTSIDHAKPAGFEDDVLDDLATYLQPGVRL